MKIREIIIGGVLLLAAFGTPVLAEEYGYVQCDEYVNIRSGGSTNSDVLGKVYNNGQVLIEYKVDGWYKVKSGSVEGYIKADFVSVGEEAQQQADANAYNTAYVYPEVLYVRAEASEDSYVVDQVYNGQELEVVDVEGDWAKVCLAPDSYGYVSAYYVDYNTYYGQAESVEEEQARLDQEWLEYLAQQEAEQAAAEAAYIEYLNSLNYYEDTNEYYDAPDQYYYDDSSSDNYCSDDDYDNCGDNYYEEPSAPVSTGSSGGNGQYLSDYAKQYVGNPYVYGGTSLLSGADCSGFTMAVLAANGITVNGRTAADQAAGGTKVSLSDAQAGDLIYYDNGSGVYHIAIYNGDGTVTHSSNSRTGVTVSDMNYSGNAAGAVRYW